MLSEISVNEFQGERGGGGWWGSGPREGSWRGT